MPPATDDVLAALDALRAEVEACTRCPLHETRTRAVFGEGDPASDLMFVGEAPGYHEDQQGRPFVGQAGKLLEQLLASIGLTREQVYIANVLKSRPPNNRDPRPEEIAACQPYLWRQIELIRPKVVCTLGNHATKLLTGDQTGITRVHGRPQATTINGVDLYLYPIFHPAAALYTPAMLNTLKDDFLRLPELMAHAAPHAGEASEAGTDRPAWRPPERHAEQPAVAQASGGQADLLSAPPLTPHGEPSGATPGPADQSPPESPAPAPPADREIPGPPLPEDAESESSRPSRPEDPESRSLPSPEPAPPEPPQATTPPAEPGPPEQLGLF